MAEKAKTSVLIVDDELYIVEMLKAIIDWKKLNLTCAGVAYDGILAYEKITLLQPDIVIADIRLPGLNGLDLIKRCNDEQMKTRFIVISGYGQFQYAQTAMQYGVREYILKPIKAEDISAALKRTQEMIEQSSKSADASMRHEHMFHEYKNVLRDNFLSTILEKHPVTDSLEKLNQQYMLTLAPGIFQILLLGVDCDRALSAASATAMVVHIYNELRSDLIEPLSSHCFDIVYKALPTRAVALLNFHPSNLSVISDEIKIKMKYIVASSQKYGGLGITLAKGLRVSRIEDIAVALSSAESALLQRIMPNAENIIDAAGCAGNPKSDVSLSSSDVHLIQSAIKNGSDQALQECLETVLSVYCISDNADARTYWNLAMQIFSVSMNTLIQLCSPLNPINYAEKEAELRSILERCGSEEQFRCSFIEFLTKQTKAHRNLTEGARNNVVFVIDRYIAANYMRKITLKALSELVYLNPVYLSMFFKRLKGINVIDYINEFRIGKAKELLRNSMDPIYSISEQVGFPNAKYFTKVFHHFVGMSPSEYRKGTDR